MVAVKNIVHNAVTFPSGGKEECIKYNWPRHSLTSFKNKKVKQRAKLHNIFTQRHTLQMPARTKTMRRSSHRQLQGTAVSGRRVKR